MEKKTKDVEMKLRGMLSLDEQNEELRKENLSLKRQIGGLKTSNASYHKQMVGLKKELEMANFTNDELRGQIASYNNQILDYNDRISELKQEIEELNSSIEYERKPWWKKLF